MRRNHRGFCQFIAVGCLAVLVLAAVAVVGIGYLFLHHKKAATTVPISPTPALVVNLKPSPTPEVGEPLWVGTLVCRGKEVPTENFGGTCYVGSLDLAKVLTSSELERVHRRNGSLLLDQQAVGRTLSSHGEDLVPVSALFSALGLQLDTNDAAHTLTVVASPTPKAKT
jgi:hypothetical protein